MKGKVIPDPQNPEHNLIEECLSAVLQADGGLRVADPYSPDKSEAERLSLKANSSPNFLFASRRAPRPRFDSADLMQHLRSTYSACKTRPLEVYADDLLWLTQQWQSVFPDSRPVLSVIRDYHVLVRLKRLNEDQTEIQTDIDEYKALVLGEEEQAEKQYCVLLEALRIVSALAAKFKLVKTHQFAYRLTNRAMNLKVLDLVAMNDSLYTMETLWFALMKDEPPVEAQLELGAKSFAEILVAATEEVVQQAATLNWHLTRQSSLKTGSLEAQKKQEAGAQSLHVRSVFVRCFKPDPAEERVFRLKNLIANFDAAYRQFEKALLCSFL